MQLTSASIECGQTCLGDASQRSCARRLCREPGAGLHLKHTHILLSQYQHDWNTLMILFDCRARRERISGRNEVERRSMDEPW